MALQTKSIVGDGSRAHHRFTLNITENSTDVNTNTSSVSFSFVLSPIVKDYDWSYSNTVPVTYSININGSVYSGNIMKYDGVSTVTVRAETLTVQHNDDGAKTISFSFSVSSIDKTFLPGTASASGSMGLTYIPRASTISCTEANIESNPTISIYRASSSFTHTITYQFGSLSGTIADRTSATSITNWTIPPEFYAQIPNAKRGYGILTCTTYSGGTPIGSSPCTFWVSTDEAKCKPTVSGTVIDTNDTTFALTGNRNILVRYCSTALCTLSVTLNKSAGSIKAKTINNNAISGNTLTIPNVEIGTFDFYAKDSREYFDQDKVTAPTIQLIPYIPLTNDATVYRDDPTSGAATLKIEGNYFKGSFGKESNELTVKYKQSSGDYVSVTPNISNNRYSVTIPLENVLDPENGFDYTQSYNFEVVVTDKLSTISKPLTLQKGVPVFDWGESDFNFNVPVNIMGYQAYPTLLYTIEQVNNFDFSDGRFHIGYGIIEENGSKVGYLCICVMWINFQMRFLSNNSIYRRMRYGNNAWSEWASM